MPATTATIGYPLWYFNELKENQQIERRKEENKVSNNNNGNNTDKDIRIVTGLDLAGIAEYLGDEINTLDEEAFNKKLKQRCYLCGKAEDSETYHLLGSEIKRVQTKLLPFDVVIYKSTHLRYLLCINCLMMLDAVLGNRHKLAEGEESPAEYPPAF
jgi:hypothetical protein